MKSELLFIYTVYGLDTRFIPVGGSNAHKSLLPNAIKKIKEVLNRFSFFFFRKWYVDYIKHILLCNCKMLSCNLRHITCVMSASTPYVFLISG